MDLFNQQKHVSQMFKVINNTYIIANNFNSIQYKGFYYNKETQFTHIHWGHVARLVSQLPRVVKATGLIVGLVRK